jgi:hypothetical protein
MTIIVINDFDDLFKTMEQMLNEIKLRSSILRAWD